MMNKNGKGGGTVAIWLIVILLGVLVVGGIFGLSQTALDKDQQLLNNADCETAPSISVSSVNALKKGTTVSATANARVNDVYVGSIPSELEKGSKVEILLNASDFIDTTIDEFTVACGSNVKTAELYATNTAAFRIFNTNNQLLTDAAAGGATNQSASTTSVALTANIDGIAESSTGDLVIVIEATNTTEVKDIIWSGHGAKKVATPKFYSANSAGSVIEAFEVPAHINGESKAYTLTITPESGETIGGADQSVYVTAYSKQAFVDTDGKFKVGVEDADGTVKYEDTWDFDFGFSA